MSKEISIHPEFSLSSGYVSSEQRPWYLFFERMFSRSRKIEPFNLGRTFEEMVEMINSGQHEEDVLLKKILSVALNILSLRQEVLGSSSTIEVVTPIFTPPNGENAFMTELHSIQDLREMFDASLQHIPPSQRPRSRLEINQLFHRWEVATQVVENIKWLGVEDQIKQLETLGFLRQEIEITPSLIANIPSVRGSITSVKDLIKIMSDKTELTVWVGPAHHVSISPPHWMHAQGKSSFAWDTQLVVNPSTAEIWLREHGHFSHTPLSSILKVLAFEQPENKVFSSEAEVMGFINVVLGHSDISPQALLQHIVSGLEGYTPASKMDSNVVEGRLPIEKYLLVIEELFRFELQRVLRNPAYMNGMYERLQFMADRVKHLIALNDPSGLPEILEEYRSQFADISSATRPSQGLGRLHAFALGVNPKLATPLDWSMFDCVFNQSAMLSKISGQGVNGLGGECVKKRCGGCGNTNIPDHARFCPKCAWQPGMAQGYQPRSVQPPISGVTERRSRSGNELNAQHTHTKILPFHLLPEESVGVGALITRRTASVTVGEFFQMRSAA